MRELCAWAEFRTTSITIEGQIDSLVNLNSLGQSGYFCFFCKTSLVPLTFFFFIRGVPFGSFETAIGFAIISFGTIMITLAIISLCLTLIYEETKHRPRYVVEATT